MKNALLALAVILLTATSANAFETDDWGFLVENSYQSSYSSRSRTTTRYQRPFVSRIVRSTRPTTVARNCVVPQAAPAQQAIAVVRTIPTKPAPASSSVVVRKAPATPAKPVAQKAPAKASLTAKAAAPLSQPAS